VEEEILYAADHVDRQLARNICGAMMFEGDKALKKVSVLSGGEKSRVMLGKLLVTPTNLLLLDEPTNHLDMDSCDALLAALDNFPGAVIMVTHNEMFLHALADKLIVFKDSGVTVMEDGYGRFLESNGWEDAPEAPCNPEADEPEETPTGTRLPRRELRRKRSEILTRRGRAVKPIEGKIAAAEDDIDAREKEMAGLNEALLAASQSGRGADIAELSRQLHTCQGIIDRRFDELERLMAEHDAIVERFDRELAVLDQQLA
jgi:ATP-binding cassette subfamily F protein 3